MEWVNVAVAVMVPGIAALLGWNWSLTNQVTELRVAIAGQYHTKSELTTLLDKALEPVNRDLDEIKRLLRERDENYRQQRTGPGAGFHGGN
jgi:hypothetical protein